MATSTRCSTVLVLDFGAQYGQLIARRVRNLNVYSEIVPCDISADEVREKEPWCHHLVGRSGKRVCRRCTFGRPGDRSSWESPCSAFATVSKSWRRRSAVR